MATSFGTIKRELKRGIAGGIAAVKERASAVSGKIGELTAEGKRQYAIYDLKAKIQDKLALLGERCYVVLAGDDSAAAAGRVKAVFGKIRKLEEQLRRLEGGKENKAAVRGKPALKSAAARKRTTRASVKPPALTAGKGALK